MSTPISPFSEEQLENIKNLINPLNEIQLAWISGYLAGRSQLPLPQQNGKAAEVPAADQVNRKLTILYGSRTGNGKGLAKMTEKMAADIGLPVEVKSMEDYQPKELVNEQYLLIIVSTHGDGVPPFQAKAVYDHLHGKRAQRLDETQYAVLALGDSSYFHFCKTGKDFDSKLEALGAKRIREILCCDVDYKQSDEVWIQETLADFKRLTGSGSAETTVKPAGVKTEKSVLFTKQNPYAAQVFEKINLHGRGSERTTLHIELQADVAGLSYEPGDSAGIIPVNSKELITELLQVTALNPDETIEINGIKRKLEEALYRDLELSKITPDVIKRYLEQFPDNKLEAVYKDQQALQTYIYGRDIVDLLTDYPVKLTAAQLVSILKPLQPRYYSIASSPNAYPGEIHLTVALVDYEQGGRNKRGACTGFLSDVLEEDEHVPVFIESNPNFRLPANPATPIIMIGAGTGVAPYRAFVQERALNPESGKSWLFFGNRHFETEFLYQTEWQQHLKSGALTRMDVAFSRDGEKPVYVQHRLLEQAEDIYQWIEEGAHIYICGDMKKMAVDVQNALSTILRQEGGYNADEAQEYLNSMQQEKRLQLDVY